MISFSSVSGQVAVAVAFLPETHLLSEHCFSDQNIWEASWKSHLNSLF